MFVDLTCNGIMSVLLWIAMLLSLCSLNVLLLVIESVPLFSLFIMESLVDDRLLLLFESNSCGGQTVFCSRLGRA